MADTTRIMSRLPIALRIAEPHPNPERPGDSPALKQGVIHPGVNDGVDADLFKAWSATASASTFVASSDDIKAGNTDGKLYEMSESEPDQEFGFEPALKKAVEVGKSDASKGSTLTGPGPVKAEDMRTGSTSEVVAPVLTVASGATLKTPATDANLAQGKPAETKK